MNLIVDIGNSSVKLAVFEKQTLIFLRREKANDLEHSVLEILNRFPKIKQIYVASVVAFDRSHFSKIFSSYKLFFLDSKSKFPFVNLYHTPESLGPDRMALVAAAVCKYANQNVLIIDAGTCITYDFVDAKSNYHGGAISPGIQMRYKALYENTDRLPLLEPTIPTHIVGDTTQSAIHSGVVLGVVNEIEGVVASYKSKYSGLKVILSGGDANFLCKQFKISIFAVSNFLLEGLNFLLEYNSNK